MDAQEKVSNLVTTANKQLEITLPSLGSIF